MSRAAHCAAERPGRRWNDVAACRNAAPTQGGHMPRRIAGAPEAVASRSSRRRDAYAPAARARSRPGTERRNDMTSKVALLACIAALAVAAGGAAVSTARADDPPACPSSTGDAYAMTARALTGQNATDVELRFTPAAGC